MRAIPKFPDELSTSRAPRRRVPSASQCSMTYRATRSFVLPSGLSSSSLANTSNDSPPNSRANRTIGVLPTTPAMDS
jgi:hypothetical protein